MHIGDKQIQAAIVIVIEELNPHGAPGGSRKIGLSLLDKTLPALVLVVMIRAHHIQKVDVGPAVAIEIRNGGISAPSMRREPHRRGLTTAKNSNRSKRKSKLVLPTSSFPTIGARSVGWSIPTFVARPIRF